MQIIKEWEWTSKHFAYEERFKRRSLVKIEKVWCANQADWEKVRMSDVCLITGDAATLPDDVKKFEAWGIPHDVYCVNRSIVFFDRPVHHWAAIDNEESTWLPQYDSEKIHIPGRPIWKHTIGGCRGYDFYWISFDPADEMTDHARRHWGGNTGYFAILTAAEMGYKRVILAGIPLDNSPHWYDPPEANGPQWLGIVYQQWMDYKMKVPFADNVRSLSGYTAFIFGDATKEWVKYAV